MKRPDSSSDVLSATAARYGAWRQAGKNFRVGKDAFGEDELAYAACRRLLHEGGEPAAREMVRIAGP